MDCRIAQNSTIVMWDTKNYQIIATLKQGDMPLYGLHTLANGKVMSAGDENGFLYFWYCQ